MVHINDDIITSILGLILVLDLFCRVISKVSWPIVTKLCHTCLMATVAYKIGLEIWGPLLQKIGGQKYHNFGAISNIVAT